MSVLSWEQPEKIMTSDEWLLISADSAPPGVYTPNMSKEDRLKWKAKYIAGKYERVEIRKSTERGVQLVVVVSSAGTPIKKDKWKSRTAGRDVSEGHDVNVRLSMNGTANLTFAEFEQLNTAVAEARGVLEAKAR